MGYIQVSSKNIIINNNILDLFFKDNDITQIRLSRILAQLNNKNRNLLDNAYMEYLMNLKEEFHQNEKTEIYSNIVMSEAFKGTKINREKITVEEIAKIYKDNYNKIINYMDEIFQSLNDNINFLPFSIQCMYYMLSQLLEKIYTNKRPNHLISKINDKNEIYFQWFYYTDLI